MQVLAYFGSASVSGDGKQPDVVLPCADARRHSLRPGLELLEKRLTLTGNIAITNALLVNTNDQPLTDVNAGEEVYVEADFTTQGLPSDASYRVASTVNGLTIDSGYINLWCRRIRDAFLV